MQKFFFFFLTISLFASAASAGELVNYTRLEGKKKQVAGKGNTKSAAKKKKTTSFKRATARSKSSKKTNAKARNKNLPSKRNKTELALDDFSRNKGNFCWPIDEASIKTGFGLYRVGNGPIKYPNPGLTLASVRGASVRSIFEGVVKSMFLIEGTWSVMIQHGSYFSVYSNLSCVNVFRDSKISAGEIIGQAADNDEGEAELEFLLLKKNKNIDPEPWIKRK
jgi:septal ring factor EnvC (AmiA/AmiB activator)